MLKGGVPGHSVLRIFTKTKRLWDCLTTTMTGALALHSEHRSEL